MAGCYAQDLRVIREEGSVGTVFQTESRNVNEGASEEEAGEEGGSGTGWSSSESDTSPGSMCEMPDEFE